jgi:hypothetical protein
MLDPNAFFHTAAGSPWITANSCSVDFRKEQFTNCRARRETSVRPVRERRRSDPVLVHLTLPNLRPAIVQRLHALRSLAQTDGSSQDFSLWSRSMSVMSLYALTFGKPLDIEIFSNLRRPCLKMFLYAGKFEHTTERRFG